MVRTSMGVGTCVDLLNPGPSLSFEFNQYAEYFVDQLRTSKTKKVIILEDDVLSRKILEANIHVYDPNIYCFHATTEKDVLDILKAFECNLLLADYYLGGPKTGLDICQTVKECSPNTERAIVSQLTNDQYTQLSKDQAIVTGAKFLHKPVSPIVMDRFLDLIFGEMEHA